MCVCYNNNNNIYIYIIIIIYKAFIKTILGNAYLAIPLKLSTQVNVKDR